MDNREFITKEEKEKCRKVMEAYAELYEKTDVLVVDAGKYGFVKLQYFNAEKGFDDAVSFLESQAMFEDLWEEWRMLFLLEFAKGTSMVELDYKHIFQYLPEDKKNELLNKKIYFAERAGIDFQQIGQQIHSMIE